MATQFKVGDRVRYPYNGSVGTVTAITARGFNWRLDEPFQLGPRYGWYQEGESYTDEKWELASLHPDADLSNGVADEHD